MWKIRFEINLDTDVETDGSSMVQGATGGGVKLVRVTSPRPYSTTDLSTVYPKGSLLRLAMARPSNSGSPNNRQAGFSPAGTVSPGTPGGYR